MSKEYGNKYWESEQGETVEFGKSFMRCFDESGKLQFGKVIKTDTNEKKYIVKFVIDRKELFDSHEGVDYLRGTLDDWEEAYEGERDG